MVERVTGKAGAGSAPRPRRRGGKGKAGADTGPPSTATASGHDPSLVRLGRMVETNGGGCLEAVPGFTSAQALTDGFRSSRLPGPPQDFAWMAGPALRRTPFYVGYGPQVPHSATPPSLVAPEFAANLESVIDADDRAMVPDTSRTPWRCICQLVITHKDGAVAHGTGWLASRRTVITAAHCLRDPRVAEREADQIQVTPGRNGPTAPYGFFTTKAWAVAEGWPGKGNGDPSRDFGAVFLPEGSDAPLGDKLGYFGLASFGDTRLDRLLVNNAGYPYEARKPYGTLWFNGGRIQKVEPRFLSYMIDTEVGSSGSPVFFYDSTTGQRQVIAIHTTGFFPNRGIRVTPEVQAELATWIDHPRD